MNCKPGDLAVIVRSEMGNEGKLLTCIALHPAGYDNAAPWLGPMWETDRNDITCANMIDVPIRNNSLVPDAFLRPIRGQLGDESFVIKARKTLPRKKPVTGPVTINERGEVAATFEQMRRALGRRSA